MFPAPKKIFLGVGLGVLVLLLLGLILGFYSLTTMREVVSDQFNKQQLVLAEQAARRIESDFNIILQELSVLNQSPTVQYLDEPDWAQRMRVTLAVIGPLGVMEIGRVNREGTAVSAIDRLYRTRSAPVRDAVPAEAVRRVADPGQKGKWGFIRLGPPPAGSPQHRLVMVTLPCYLESTNRAHPAVKQEFAGLLYGLVDLSELTARTVKEIHSGRTGYTWVIDPGGDFLYHPLTEFIGQNAFTVRAQQGTAVSFDRINRLQKEKMLRGDQGTSWYISGWHRGLKGEIKKLIAYSPIRLDVPGESLLGSVAVAAPVTEVDETIQSVYTRQFLMQGIIIFSILLGGVLLLVFSWQYARTLKAEVEERTEDWRASEERYRKLVESAQDLIFTLDREGRILSLNRYGSDFLGGVLFRLDFPEPSVLKISEDPAVTFRGKSIFETIPPAGGFHRQALEEIWSNGRPKVLEHPVRIGINEFWLSTQLLAVKDDRGEIQSILGISRDISIRKRMEAQMINTERLASLGFLSASIAHEINSPIGIILGYCDYLLELVPPEEDTHALLQKIEQQGNRCKKIIDHLLGFARYAEPGEDAAEVNGELENVLSVAGKVLAEKKIEVVKGLENKLPPIKVDPIPLQQVFLNLINNAIAAMPRGGSLRVETRWDVHQDKVRVVFSDSGTGIDPHHRDHVFEPFFTTKKAGDGTGLGLSVCENIVSTYGGFISLESRTEEEDSLNHGTTLTITFPVRHTHSSRKTR